MAEKESELTLSDLTDPKNDSMERGYSEVSQARDEAASPTAQLLKARAAMVKTFKKPDPDAARAMPVPGIVAPGAESDARGVPAAPGEEPQKTLGHVESQSISREPLVQEGTMERGAMGQAIVPSLGEALKQIPGGVFQAVKNLLALPQELGAAFRGFNDDMIQTLAESKGAVPPDIQAKLDALRGQPDADSRAAAILAKVGERLPQIAEPDSVGGSLIRGLSAFLVPFSVARKVTGTLPLVEKLSKASLTLGKTVAGSLAGIPADLVAFDPASPRMANLIKRLHPSLNVPVVEFLAAPEMEEGQELALEQRLKERVKNAAEGLILGGAIDLLVTSVIAARKYARVAQAARRMTAARVVLLPAPKPKGGR